MRYFLCGEMEKSCCFIGHRNAQETPKLLKALRDTVLDLIKNKGVETFIFGSKSRFDDLCLDIVNQIKNEHGQIKLIYFRSQYKYIDQSYRDYLLKSYDDTLIPERVENAGRASYLERNQAMIDQSDICVFFYDKDYQPPLRKYNKRAMSTYQPKSGTRLAYEYAKRKKKEIINLYDSSK